MFGISTVISKNLIFSLIKFGALALLILTLLFTWQKNELLTEVNKSLEKDLLDQQLEYEQNLASSEEQLELLELELSKRESLLEKYYLEVQNIEAELASTLFEYQALKAKNNEVKEWSDTFIPIDVRRLLNGPIDNQNSNEN